MRSSYPISLFSAAPRREGGPSAFAVSIVAHGVLFALLFLSVKHVSVIEEKPLNLTAVRLLDVQQQPAAALQWVPQQSAKLHTGQAARHAMALGGRRGVSAFARMATVPKTFQPQRKAPQTLIQPDIPPVTRVLPPIPVPQAVVWTAGEVTRRTIVPPTPQPLGAIPVHPTLEKPNHELAPAEISLSSTPFETKAPLPAPGTTMPIQVDGPQPARQMPQTASVDKQAPTASRVISLSELKLQTGTAALPAINEVAPGDNAGPLAPGDAVSQAGGMPGTGTGSLRNGTGMGHAAGSGGDNGAGATAANGANTGMENGKSGRGASGPGFTVMDGSATNSIAGNTGPPEHISLPKNGQYGMVVVGAEPQEDVPETTGLWGGRMVYTVYLQTDTPQNWILQYSLPSTSSDPPTDKLDAPWPYDMMRPNLGKYDIVLVHGYIDENGRFGQLMVAYPPRYPKADMLLRNLKQWAFRPAMLNGMATRVEVLLVIPGQSG